MLKYTEQANRFYKSKAWKETRKAYIESVNGLCERCLAKRIINTGYIVHHKEHINAENINDPSITLNFNNLEYLCLECHNKEHGVGNSGEVLRDGLIFNDNGELVQSPH